MKTQMLSFFLMPRALCGLNASLVILLLCGTGFSGFVQASYLFQLSPQTDIVTTGDSVSVTGIFSGLTNPPSVGAFDIFLGFNSAIVAPTSIDFGPNLGDPSLFEAITATQMTSSFVEAAEVSLLSNTDLDSLQTSSFILFTANFIAIANGEAVFSYLGGPIDDGNGNLLFGTKTVPEPSTLALLGFGFMLSHARYRRKPVSISKGKAGVLGIAALFVYSTASFAEPCAKVANAIGGFDCAAPGAVCNGGRGVCNDVAGFNTAGDCFCIATTPPPCKDPGAIVTFSTNQSLVVLPVTATFVPTGNVTLTGINALPVNVPISGSFEATFTSIPDNKVQAEFSNWNLTVSSFTLDSSANTGATQSLLRGPENFAIIDSLSGSTNGGIWTTAKNSQGRFEPGAVLGGVLNFATGEWTISTGNAGACLRCDIDGSGQVDIADISLITNKRGTKAGLEDSMDVDNDGLVTTNDARICVLSCNKPKCAR